MKIILNKEEIYILKNYLGVDSDIKYINFETSHIFIGELSHILTGYFDKIHNSYRIAYKLDTKRKELTFYNDFPKYDREFQEKVMFSKIQ